MSPVAEYMLLWIGIGGGGGREKNEGGGREINQ